MNVIKLMGGLGNQLFQYAFGRVQEANGIDVCFDLSWFSKESNSHRKYRLEHLGLRVKKDNFLRQQIIKEKGYDPSLLITKNKNFYGYWQYLNYYKDIVAVLKNEIKVDLTKWKIYLDEIKKGNYVVLHVRRADYLIKNKCLLPLSYYEEALKSFKNKEIAVFSDDPIWCKINLPGFVIDINDYASMYLMSKCPNQVISKSTFSWWAAMLNENVDKKIVCPSEFIIRKEDKNNYNNKIHYPNEWIKI